MRRFNFETLLKIGVLCGFSFFFFKIVKSGEISSYVHPRIIPFIIMTILTMIVIILFLIPEIFNKNKVKKKITSYVLFIIPLIMAFTFNVETMTSGFVKPGNINIKGDAEDKDHDLKHEEGTEKYIVQDTNFVEFIENSNKNFKDYKGKKIEITGFVCRDDSLGKDQFVVGRFMMTCCAADMSVVGIVCNSNEIEIYENDTWVKAVGTLEETVIDGESVTVLCIEYLEKTDVPKNQYVYPY